MTNTEFSNEFDILYNNIMSNAAPGLNEYEKSVFLTKAQDEILKNYFNPLGNKYQQGFDGNAKRQIDFSKIVKNAKLTAFSGSTYTSIDARSKKYTFPADVFMSINETVTVTRNTKSLILTVIPLSFDEYMRLMVKPYKYPIKSQAWRLLSYGTNANIAEIIVPDTEITDYTIRYVKKPKPIILTNLSDTYSDVSIEGTTDVTECELDPILHPEILQRAVELAKAAYTGDIKDTVELGKRSE